MEPSCVLSTSPDFADLAVAELRRAAPAARLSAIAPGIHFVAGVSFRELANTWRAHPPTFVRHIAPIDFTQPLTGGEADLAALTDRINAALAPRMGKGGPFSVQSRVFDEASSYKTFDLNVATSEQLAQATGLSIEVRRPHQIISILIHAGRAHVGLSSPAENLSRWSGGQHRLAREEDQLSRAEFKLLEAIDSFGLRLPPNGRALDLGAAPGGWTRILRKQGQHVVAIDPARLHPSLESDASVEHHAIDAERYVASTTQTFDAILNDIRQEPRDTAALMERCAPLLKAGGFALATIKLRHTKREQILAATLQRLSQTYAACRARQLFHNRSEVTVVLREPKADSAR